MLLADLIGALAPLQTSGPWEREITGIQYDSRLIQPGNLFVAIPGFSHDGHDYLADAAARGAVAAIIANPVFVPKQLTSIRVTDSRRALGTVAAMYCNHPSQQLRVIGVTGTNGKTTTTFLSESLLRMARLRTGLIGTVCIRVAERELSSVRTTPESLDLQQLLAQMVAADVSHAILEVSSHGLALGRMVGTEVDVAVFTNLSQDHLDLHGDMDNYLATKAQLFADLACGQKQKKRAIINIDDPAAAQLLQICRVPTFTYGITHAADLQAVDVVITSAGTEFSVLHAQELLGRTKVLTPGYFSVYNALAAIAVALTEGVPWQEIAANLPASPVVPGRFQAVVADQPFTIIVDYAHTPDGLENIIKTACDFAEGRVIVVFGCGGDRDRSKRPQMGRVAGLLADVIVVTTDNPRSEEPRLIAEDILRGIPEDALVEVELDRALAIHKAIALAQAGDVVIIAGKGHETYQEFADRIIHFDDRQVAEQALEVSKHEGMDLR